MTRRDPARGRPAGLRWGVWAALGLCGAGCGMGYTMAPARPGPVCPVAGDPPSSGAEAELPPIEVEWLAPSDERDRGRLDAWCSTVGAPVLSLRPPRTLLAADTLTIAVWNVAVGTADVPAFLRGELDHPCRAAAPDPATPSRPFVLLLQEAFRRSELIPDVPDRGNIPWRLGPGERPGEILDIEEIAESCGLSVVYVPSSRNGSQTENGLREDRGNAVLSTLALSDPTAIELPFEGGRKVAVAATVTLGGESLRVVSLHLDVASTLVRTLVTGYGTRIRQASALADAIDMDRPALATVAAGDFNTWSEAETALRRFALRFPDSPPIEATPTRTHFPTDHAFFRSGDGGAFGLVEDSYRRVERLYHSDHHARLLELTIR